MATLQQFIDDIRAATDQDGGNGPGVAVTAGAITDAQLVPLIQTEVDEVRSIVNRVAPDAYMTALTFTIASGNTYPIVASDFERARILEYTNDTGVSYTRLRQFNLKQRGWVGDRCWRIYGQTITVEPSTTATGSYRLWYTASHATLAVGSPNATVAVPTGAGRKYVVQGVAAAIRARFDEDPSYHLALRDAARQELLTDLQRRTGELARISDVGDGDLYDDWWN